MADTPVLALPELDRECTRCQGNGIVTTPEWMAWREREIAAEEAWRSDHPGESYYSSAAYRAIEERQPEPEMACPDCGGSGHVLTEAGRELLAFLRRHQ